MDVRKTWRTIRPHLPRPVVEAVTLSHREWMRARCLVEGVAERPTRRAVAGAVPPPFLRYRVDGSVRLGHFLQVGEGVARDIASALATIGRDLGSFSDILDFGCGCGRVLRFVRGRAGPARGCMALTSMPAPSPGAARICRTPRSPPTATCPRSTRPTAPSTSSMRSRSSPTSTRLARPPGPPSWRGSRGRVGSCCSPSTARRAPSASSPRAARLGDEGFVFARADSVRGLFPEWYQASYQTPEHARAIFGASFDVLRHIPRGITGFQDAVLLGKAGDGPRP